MAVDFIKSTLLLYSFVDSEIAIAISYEPRKNLIDIDIDTGEFTVNSFSSISLGILVMYRFFRLSVGLQNSIISNIDNI